MSHPLRAYYTLQPFRELTGLVMVPVVRSFELQLCSVSQKCRRHLRDDYLACLCSTDHDLPTIRHHPCTSLASRHWLCWIRPLPNPPGQGLLIPHHERTATEIGHFSRLVLSTQSAIWEVQPRELSSGLSFDDVSPDSDLLAVLAMRHPYSPII